MKLFLLLFSFSSLFAGEAINGAIRYELSIAQPFQRKLLTEKQLNWKRAVLPKLRPYRSVLTFAPTTLTLIKNGKPVTDSIYQCIERPYVFYDTHSNTCLDFKHRHLFFSGGGGFHMEVSPNRSIIVCTNYGGGLPYVLQDITAATAQWMGIENDDLSK